MNSNFEFVGINTDTLTAGPGMRLELFTKGCIRGIISPCDGCFNSDTWTFEGKRDNLTIDEASEVIRNKAWNKLVTFCGGEPILQGLSLLSLVKKLKEEDPDYHFLLYTSYNAEALMKVGLSFVWKEEHGEAMFDFLKKFSYNYYEKESGRYHFDILSSDHVKELFSFVDMIVDGTYQHKNRLTNSNTMHKGWFIGSSNQRVIYGPSSVIQGELIYDTASDYNRKISHGVKTCLSCMDLIDTDGPDVCSYECELLYEEHLEDVKIK